MVTEVVINGQKSFHDNGTQSTRSEYYWLSTDEKPIEGVENADPGCEMDTQKVFLFDGENKVWNEQ